MPRLRLLVPLTVPVALVLGASPVLAYTAVSPVLVSDASPWAACLDGQSPGDGSTNYAGAEVEPFVAVDPTDSSHIIGVFQQDRWNDGGAHGLRAASSFDGGQTWPTKSFAHFSTCSGSTNTDYVRASDPWVTFDTDGNAYQISLSFSATQVISAVLVSKLPKGGTMWSNPTTLIRDVVGFHFNDKESITGDPARPGYVYAVWDRGTFPSDSRNFRSFFGSHAFRGPGGEDHESRKKGEEVARAANVLAHDRRRSDMVAGGGHGQPEHLHDRQPDRRPAGRHPGGHLPELPGLRRPAVTQPRHRGCDGVA